MNVALTESGYTLDGKWRLVPVEPPQQSPGPDCRTCANRGRVNGLSQETYCDGCAWYGAYWKKNHYKPLPEPAP